MIIYQAFSALDMGSDVLLGPEMKSTGEVMGIGKDFESAFAKAYISSKNKLPLCGFKDQFVQISLFVKQA